MNMIIKQSNMKPLYTLNSIDLLVKYALNYAMGTHNFSIECRAEQGFKVTYQKNDTWFFHVINTNSIVIVYISPAVDVQTEFNFSEIDNNIYSLKDSFDTWIRALYELQRSSQHQLTHQ